MKYNYHTHTYLCSHATGLPEEYVLRAIENGIKYMGFSDHMPLKYSDGFESDYRVKVADVPKYYSEIFDLKEKYRDKIVIKIGFEMEYYEEMFDEMVKNAISYGAEYLILGQHYIAPENYAGAKHTCSKSDDCERVEKYSQSVISAMERGVFSYIAHPDMINFVGDENFYKDHMRKICKASAAYNVPLEINFMGIRGNRCYPNPLFWEIAGEESSPVTMGFDSHDTMSAYDDMSLVVAEKLIEEYSLNYIGMPEIINIQELK